MVDKADMVDIFRNIFLLGFGFLIYLTVPAATAAVPSLLQPSESSSCCLSCSSNNSETLSTLSNFFREYEDSIDKNPIT
jgi:hypothetical protein